MRLELMKIKTRIIIILALGFALNTKSVVSDIDKITFTPLTPEVEHKKVVQLMVQILTKQHYKKKSINDSLSIEIYDRYLNNLDGNHFYFLQEDINEFQKYRLNFDEFFQAGHLKPAYEIFSVYQTRFAERLEHIFQIINNTFDFTIDEYIQFNRDEAPWPKTSEELDDLWRKRIKHDALNLKLAGKDQNSITETLSKRYKQQQKYMSQYQSEDVFQILMNSLSECFDPHTNYFSPKNFDNFKISMSRSFEGIGARLFTENDYTVVQEIIPAGPADKSKLIYPNDRIIGVGQGIEGKIADVIGWRIDDVVQLIRGKKKTIVRLQLLRANTSEDFPADTIFLVRDKITLEDQSAQSDILQIQQEDKNFTFGVITVPAFYSDFDARSKGEPDYKSTTRDVKKLILDLETKNIDGIIIDLRRNGGGFLNEAIELTGLFIDEGPVVQVRNSFGKVKIENDYESGQIYEGPLAVLVNRFSASASEIFAAAIQDYNRGIVIGSQTFGKGTVQNAIDLNRYLSIPSKRLGQLKLTIAKFYRINGGSTQHVGVIPDIVFPSTLSLMDIGESVQKNALLWDEIDSVEHNDYYSSPNILAKLELRHSLRLSNNEDYANLLANIEEYEENKDKKKISLQEQKRRNEREKRKEGDTTSESDSLNVEDEQKEDLLLEESGHILSDYILISS
jgi:carboxyl-terminal processing protease